MSKMVLGVKLAIAFCLTCFSLAETAQGTKPHFISEPGKVTVAYQSESVNLTWKIISNHSLNRLDFGIWKADSDTFGNTIMSLVRNGSEMSIHTSEKDNVKEYLGRVSWVGDLSTGVASFELRNLKYTDEKSYGVEIEIDDDDMNELTSSTQLIVKSKSASTVAPIPKPHFISEPGKEKVANQDESVKFIWKLSSHTFNRLDFGTWNTGSGILGNTIMSLVRNGNKTSIHPSKKDNVKEYLGRVSWVGDLSTGVAGFELTNLKLTDKKYYGVEIEFGDGEMTELTSFTKLIVKSKSASTVAPIPKPYFISEPGKERVANQDESVKFIWKLSSHTLNRLDFGTWNTGSDTFGNTIMSLVRNGNKTSIHTSKKDNAKEYLGRVSWVGDLSTGVASFELTNLKQTDEKSYGVEIEVDDDNLTELTSFTKLIVKKKIRVASTVPLPAVPSTGESTAPSTLAVTVKSAGSRFNSDKGLTPKIFFLLLVAVFIINSPP